MEFANMLHVKIEGIDSFTAAWYAAMSIHFVEGEREKVKINGKEVLRFIYFFTT